MSPTLADVRHVKTPARVMLLCVGRNSTKQNAEKQH